MGATVFFSVSLGTCILFLVFKLLDNSQRFPLYRSLRQKGDVVVLQIVNQLRARAARLERQLSIRNVFVAVVKYVAVNVAHGARKVEQHAYDVTRKMARNGNARTTKSPFLQEVSTHKQSLDTERVRRETSLTDEE